MRISEVARLTGMTDSHIRFYEKKGLLTPARKADSGYRDYSEEDVRRLKLILLYRKMDLSIEKIAALLHGQMTPQTAFSEQEQALQIQMDRLEGSLALCRMLAQEADMAAVDVDYYLHYVHEEEQKGRRYAVVEEWLDDMADFSRQTFGQNKQLFALLLLHPVLCRVVSLLIPMLLAAMPVIKLIEDYGESPEITRGTLVMGLFWGILLVTYVVGFIRYRAIKRQAASI